MKLSIKGLQFRFVLPITKWSEIPGYPKFFKQNPLEEVNGRIKHLTSPFGRLIIWWTLVSSQRRNWHLERSNVPLDQETTISYVSSTFSSAISLEIKHHKTKQIFFQSFFSLGNVVGYKDSQTFLLQIQNDTVHRGKHGTIHHIMCAYSDLALCSHFQVNQWDRGIIALFLNVPQMLCTQSNWEVWNF